MKIISNFGASISAPFRAVKNFKRRVIWLMSSLVQKAHCDTSMIVFLPPRTDVFLCYLSCYKMPHSKKSCKLWTWIYSVEYRQAFNKHVFIWKSDGLSFSSGFHPVSNAHQQGHRRIAGTTCDVRPRPSVATVPTVGAGWAPKRNLAQLRCNSNNIWSRFRKH